MNEATKALTVIGTKEVKSVLVAFINDFLVDVPAIHRDGEYLIEIDTLENHVRSLDDEDLSQIAIEASGVLLGV